MGRGKRARRKRNWGAVPIEELLKGLIKHGTLEAALPNGRRIVAGDGGEPYVAVAITKPLTVARFLANPSLAVAEAYADGRLTLERGSIRDLVDLAARNAPPQTFAPRPGPIRRWFARHLAEANPPERAKANIARHYDLPVAFYRLFLDEDMQYSCAYFVTPDMTLETAQAAKKRHIAAKLILAEGQSVLDIGCGWGGLALSLSAWTGAMVHGLTLSTEQLETAQARARAGGLDALARFSLSDYRQTRGPYDRVVSVGMFEHVGRPNYQTYFDQIARLLSDDGVAVIHSIGRSDGPSATDAFTARYIFPGGYIPALSEVLPSVEKSGLWLTDVEILRLHYARTLQCWHERFQTNRPAAVELMGERFCRIWEFYLGSAEAAFRHGGLMVFQLQLTKRVGTAPLTRRYMDKAEEALVKTPPV